MELLICRMNMMDIRTLIVEFFERASQVFVYHSWVVLQSSDVDIFLSNKDSYRYASSNKVKNTPGHVVSDLGGTRPAWPLAHNW